MKVAVGSKNPVKIEAVKQAFEKVFPDETWEVIGIEVVSGVSDQPMSDKESIRGARNRAKNSLRELSANYGVGLEGGIQKINEGFFITGWMVIVNKFGNEGIGSTISMQMSSAHMKLINQGIELGHADDQIFKTENSKHKLGYFGAMTNGALPRMEAYRDGVITALTRFVHPDLF